MGLRRVRARAAAGRGGACGAPARGGVSCGRVLIPWLASRARPALSRARSRAQAATACWWLQSCRRRRRKSPSSWQMQVRSFMGTGWRGGRVDRRAAGARAFLLGSGECGKHCSQKSRSGRVRRRRRANAPLAPRRPPPDGKPAGSLSLEASAAALAAGGAPARAHIRAALAARLQRLCRMSNDDEFSVWWLMLGARPARRAAGPHPSPAAWGMHAWGLPGPVALCFRSPPSGRPGGFVWGRSPPDEGASCGHPRIRVCLHIVAIFPPTVAPAPRTSGTTRADPRPPPPPPPAPPPAGEPPGAGSPAARALWLELQRLLWWEPPERPRRHQRPSRDARARASRSPRPRASVPCLLRAAPPRSLCRRPRAPPAPLPPLLPAARRAAPCRAAQPQVPRAERDPHRRIGRREAGVRMGHRKRRRGGGGRRRCCKRRWWWWWWRRRRGYGR